MHPISLVIGLAAGAGVGIIIGVILVNKKVAQLRELQSQLEQLRSKTAEQVRHLQETEAEYKKDLADTRARLSAAESQAGKHKDEAAQYATKLKETEAAIEKDARQAEAHQAARQQAEGRLRQAEKLATEARQQADAAGARLGALQKEHDAAATALKRREDEVKRLRAQLSSAGDGSASGLDESVEIFADAGGSLDLVLSTLLEHEGQQVAVLADRTGIVVSSAGSRDLRDGVAAAAQLMSKLGKQFDGMIPFGDVRDFNLIDVESNVISGRAFTAAAETVTLATLGSHSPNGRILDGAMASLAAALD